MLRISRGLFKNEGGSLLSKYTFPAILVEATRPRLVETDFLAAPPHLPEHFKT